MLRLHPDVETALKAGRPVVALESTLIAHGLPWPVNLETATVAEEAILTENATPATIAVIDGKPTIGLKRAEIDRLARSSGVLKASRRDLATAITKRQTAATTVAATMHLAHRAGIRVFATGGIGGVHRGAETSFDVSADLTELSQTPVAVVCAGAKSILDIPKTLEMLETLSVPVVGFRTDTFPAFYVRSSGLPVSARFDTPAEVATFLQAHWELGGAGVLVAQPVAERVALSESEFDAALAKANQLVGAVRGANVTPALLGALASATGGRSLTANRELIVENARLAARIAVAMRQ